MKKPPAPHPDFPSSSSSQLKFQSQLHWIFKNETRRFLDIEVKTLANSSIFSNLQTNTSTQIKIHTYLTYKK